MRRPRIQVPIWAIQLAVLDVAILLGIRLSISRELGWVDLLALGLIALLAILGWVIAVGSWPMRLFAIGFTLGQIAENRALAWMTINLDPRSGFPGPLVPAGWYPLTVPIQRFLALHGWMDEMGRILLSHFAAMVLSGLVCGGIMLLFSRLWMMTRKRAAVPPQPACDAIADS